jgi:hypothetical protein
MSERFPVYEIDFSAEYKDRQNEQKKREARENPSPVKQSETLAAPTESQKENP